MQWKYLEGDGDFRSEEVTRLRDEADIIITNPPFSLFREFLQWIVDGNKQFLIIGNVNCISYKEVFPLLMQNKIWAGCRFNERVNGKNQTFRVYIKSTNRINSSKLLVDQRNDCFSISIIF